MTTETYNYDDVTSGSDEIATTSVTITSGQVLSALAPIGQIATTGKFVLSESDATNGSESPVYITAQEIDASSGDVDAQVFKAGTFDPEMLAWDDSFTAPQKLTAFVGTPISLQTKAVEL